MATKIVFNVFTGTFDYIESTPPGPGTGNVTNTTGIGTNDAIARYDIDGTHIKNSKALVQDGGAIQTIGYVGKKEINEAVVLPSKHYMIATGLTILVTGSITIGSDSELLLI